MTMTINGFPVTSLSAISLQASGSVSFPELYQELWIYSGSVITASTFTSAGSGFVFKGSTSLTGSSGSSGAKLYTFSANWTSTTKCAFEVTLYNNTASDITYAALWDATSNAIVSSSQVSVTSTTATVVRSTQFTLTPGHQYAVTLWSNAGTAYLTDASLIIFPPAGSVSPSLSSISLANPSGGSLKEAYIPLWVYSSGSISTTSSASGGLITKGATGALYSYSDSRVQLHTLNANWSASQKFALEASIWAQSGGTCNAELWDCTTNTAVAGTQVSTTATTATLIRSGSVNLNPSHKYGVSLWSSSNTYSAYLTKAHLVALGG